MELASLESLLHSPVNNDNRSISVAITALVRLHHEIVQARRVIQIRPIWIVKHANVHLGVFLNRLNSEVLDDVIVLLVVLFC